MIDSTCSIGRPYPWRCAGLGLAFCLLACGCKNLGAPAGPVYSDPQDTADAFDRASDQPPTAKTLYAMSKILAAQGKDPQCEYVLTRVIRMKPRFMRAYVELAELHLRHRRLDQAVAVLRGALAIDDDDAVLLNNLGMCRMVQGNYVDALQQFTLAAAAAPQDARYRANMAAALGVAGRYDESLALYQQIVPPADAHHNLSVLCEARNDSQRADQERLLAGITGSAGSNPPDESVER